MKISDGLHGFIWTSMNVNNCNTFLIDGPARVLIDPGHMRLFDHVKTGLRQVGLEPSDLDLIICTHAHPDHVEAIQWFSGTQALFALHERDWQLFQEMGGALGVSLDQESYTPDFFLEEGNLEIKGLKLEIVYTPGHSPGSISVYWPDKKALFVGDVIFKDGLGRTDLPGGDGATLKESIRKLAKLDVEYLLSGHGDVIAGADRVRKNFENVEAYWFRFI